MYIEKLKTLYYKERKELESLSICEQESQMRLLHKRKELAQRAQKRLRMAELLGRADLTEEVKENILQPNQEKIEEEIEKCTNAELDSIEKDEKDALERANYSSEEYAQYLFQLEKVYALEDALSEERLFPEAVYQEQKYIVERDKSNQPK